jgi:RHS repeat-associated protein
MQSKNRRTYGPSGGSSSSVFTAFGEPRSATLDGGDNRYGYVGAWGYQAHDEMPFLHVGHRYYDPSIGRFLQRDPIGIAGGRNIYEVYKNKPTVAIDHSGLYVINGDQMPDPNGPGSPHEKRREYFRRRMRQLGWMGCSLYDFANLFRLMKFIEHVYMVTEEGKIFYPDVPAPSPSPPTVIIIDPPIDISFPPPPPSEPEYIPPAYCNRCHKG